MVLPYTNGGRAVRCIGGYYSMGWPGKWQSHQTEKAFAGARGPDEGSRDVGGGGRADLWKSRHLFLSLPLSFPLSCKGSTSSDSKPI